MKKRSIIQYFGTDPFDAAYKLMKESEVWKDWKKDDKIGLKPNLVVSKDASSGATTHPEFAAGVISFLKDKGFKKIKILEGSWVGDSTEKAFEVCGYKKLSEKYNVKLVNLQKDETKSRKAHNGKYAICSSILKLDRLINLPVLKGHCQTYMTCAMKNLKGCIPDSEKRRYHREGLHQPIADLNEILRADLILVDGKNGDPDFEEGGNPLERNTFLAAVDPVLVDSYVADLMGISLKKVPYITKGADLGIGKLYNEKCKVISLNESIKKKAKDKKQSEVDLKDFVDERGACSKCYASLMKALSRMEKKGIYPTETIHIGQKFKGKEIKGIGIGKCLSGAAGNAKGCPPSAEDIEKFLSSEIGS